MLASTRPGFSFTGPDLWLLLFSAGIAGAVVLFHYESMSWTSRLLPRTPVRRRSRIVGLIACMLAAHVVEVWAFALSYWWLAGWPALGEIVGVTAAANEYVYFSATVFTTLGFGDIVPHGALRILVGTEALVGLSMITWSASFAFLEMQRDWAEFRQAR
ncbi:MAG: potassium channel family protein [Planctomycetota bacterium]